MKIEIKTNIEGKFAISFFKDGNETLLGDDYKNNEIIKIDDELISYDFIRIKSNNKPNIYRDIKYKYNPFKINL